MRVLENILRVFYYFSKKKQNLNINPIKFNCVFCFKTKSKDNIERQKGLPKLFIK